MEQDSRTNLRIVMLAIEESMAAEIAGHLTLPLDDLINSYGQGLGVTADTVRQSLPGLPAMLKKAADQLGK